MTSRTDGEYALSGVRVLDLAGEPGSFGSRLLADLGARVIKVENPGGDPFRGSTTFLFNNANKLGITLNLHVREGRNIFLDLVGRSDVIFESYPPGSLDSLGLGSEILKESNPSIVTVSVTGFGKEGSGKAYLATDLIASAFGGQMHICGEPKDPPLRLYGHQSHYSASLLAAISALVGMREKRRGRKELSFDISLQESVAATLEHVMVRYFDTGAVAKREGSLHWDRAFRIFPCRDGFLQMTLFQQWPTLVEWMASENMADDLPDKKWEAEDYRREHIDHAIDVIGRWTRTHTTRELFETGQALRFPWAPVRSPAEVLACPQLTARSFFKEVESPEGEVPLRYTDLPFRCGMPVPEKWMPAPRAGEHNVRIFHEELGMSLSELERLQALGVI